MSGNFERIEPQEQTSRAIDGVDYGRGVRVLARRGETLLIWVPGQAVWSGTGQPWRYAPSCLMIHRPNGRYSRLSDGGRLKAVIKAKSAEIDREFGDGFHGLLEPGATIRIGSASK